jgi:NTE family protein
MKRLGLALSGGGVRGAAHVGVLRVLEREEIPVHCVAGTSVGAIVGALYGSGVPLERIPGFTRALRQHAIRMLRLPKLGFLDSNVLADCYRELGGKPRFEDLSLPLAVLATDLARGVPRRIVAGDLVEAVRASAAIPWVFSPSSLDGAILVDGGLTDNLPSRSARDLGAEVVLAVNVVSRADGLKEVRSLLDVTLATFEIVLKLTTVAGVLDADLTLEPRVTYRRPTDFTKIDELVGAGERAMEESLPILLAMLAGHGPIL